MCDPLNPTPALRGCNKESLDISLNFSDYTKILKFQSRKWMSSRIKTFVDMAATVGRAQLTLIALTSTYKFHCIAAQFELSKLESLLEDKACMKWNCMVLKCMCVYVNTVHE